MTKILSLSFLPFLAALLLSVPATATVDWVGNMFPGAGSSNTRGAGTPLTIYAQVYDAGTTEPAGQGAGITCEIYYGEVLNFGDAWLSTNSISMSYNVDIGNNDEYFGDFAPPAGNYEFTCRCSGDGGATWTFVNLGGAGNGRLTVDAVAPVELTRFVAVPQDNLVMLHWQTASEINSDYFEIQRSSKGQNWSTIGVQRSEGNYRNGQEYSFVDEQALGGKNYYRLNMVDLDRQQVYSEVQVIEFKSAKTVKAYPNPVQESLFLEGEGLKAERLEIFSGNGQLIEQQNIESNDGIIRVAVDHLNSGMYLYRLSDQNGTILAQDRFIKN